ncbi:hypothetical protein BDM02DRAFT_3120564 [Thelephora ganbajun]|uniref:Uncharacterized protein n=1 Tax=Thelephora ganbajun TaxID=370292 RepID=A0ACB6Z6P7_THEGA|nr:hypothetical protein BDM02DRAFT_3120564 [Thelephora ganbajun]
MRGAFRCISVRRCDRAICCLEGVRLVGKRILCRLTATVLPVVWFVPFLSLSRSRP